MDYAEVDWALLHRTPYLGIGNDLVADTVRAYPDRIQALAHVPEWKIAPDPDWAIAELDHAINDLGLHGLQLLPDPHGALRPVDRVGRRCTHAILGPLRHAGDTPLRDAGLHVIGAHRQRRRHGPEASFETVSRFMERYPDVQVVLTHGLSWRSFADEKRHRRAGRRLRRAAHRQPELSRPAPVSPFFFGGMYDYPMPQIRPGLEKAVERLGAGRLMWGTDIPMVMRFQTYRQSLDSLRLNLDFLDQADIDLICGGNTARLMGVG